MASTTSLVAAIPEIHPQIQPDNNLVDQTLDLHPSPADACASEAPHSDPPSEHTALLGHGAVRSGSLETRRYSTKRQREESAQRRRSLPGWKRAMPVWMLLPFGLFKLLEAGTLSVQMELLTQISCRGVVVEHETPPVLQPPFLPPSQGDYAPTSLARTAEIAESFIASAPPAPPRTTFMGFPLARAPDEEWMHRCRRSGEVQKRTTSFLVGLQLIGGILAAMTCGLYGDLSDRVGRVPVLAIVVAAGLVETAGMIVLITFPEYLGARFAYVGASVSGLFGGDMAPITLCAAYLSDCAGDGSRTKVLSIFDAVTYAGLAIGPIFGAAIYEWSGGILLLPYYLLFAAKCVFLIMLLLVVPESLSKSRRRDERLKAEEARASTSAIVLREEEDCKRSGRSVMALRVQRLAFKPFQFLAPLAVLLPRKQAAEVEEEDLPLLRSPVAPIYAMYKRDWSLTLIAASYGLYMIVPGITGVKIVYARGMFQWGPEETGRWVTFIAVSKLSMLLLILPYGIRAFRKPVPTMSSPRPVSASSDSAPTPAQLAWDKHAAHLKLVADSKFDLSLGRFSIGLTCIAYVLYSIPWHPEGAQSLLFYVGTAFTGFAAATTPALQSLALAFSSPREAGRVLASLSALATVSTAMLGPPIFGATYVRTVDWFPEFLFIVAIIWVALSLQPLLLVRVPESKAGEEE